VLLIEKNHANLDRKTGTFDLVKQKFAEPFKFLTAPQSAAAHSLKTIGLKYG
jgi:hypothetical protein